MEIARLNEYYKDHLQAELEDFNTEGYKLSLQWEMDFTSAKNDENNIFLNDKTIYFVLSKLPSVNFEGILIQSIMISALCEQSVLPYAMAILENYQRKAITNKVWFDNVMMTETYNSPSVSQNYIALDVAYGVEVTMTGTLLFNEDVNDIAELYLFDQKIDFVTAIETIGCVQSANTIKVNENYTNLAKSINTSAVYKIDFKIIDKTNRTICELLRQIKIGNVSSNFVIPMRIIESDGFEYRKDMILSSYAKNSGRAETPLITISLVEANEILVGD